MKGKKSLSLLFAILLVFTLGLSGCSDKGATKTDGGKAGTNKKALEPLVIVPQPGGTFQNNFNPFSTNANQGTNGLIYQPLYYFSNVSQDEYPLLASEYKWTNGNKTLLVTLRDNVKWSDGKAFSADDVVFTFDLLKKYKAADTAGLWTELTSVAKKGENQVEFQFKSPDVPFGVYVLSTDIVPKHLWADLGDPTKASITKPVGTGPYLVSSFSSQLYKMKVNPDFYGGELAVKELDFPSYSGNDSAQLGLVKGDVDWAGIFIPDIEKVYQAKSEHNKFWFPPSNIVTLYTNLKNPVLKDLPVRKAMSLAIDREQLSKQAEYGYEAVASTTGLTLPRDKGWIDPSIDKAKLTFTYDQKQAVKTLEDAGYKKGDDGIFVSPDGKKLDFTLQVVSGWSDWVTISSLVAQQLKKVGISVKVQQVQFGAYNSNMTNHKFELAISWTNAGATPYYQYQDLLNSHGKWNLEQWNDPKTDQALSAFQGTTDESKQKEAIYYLENVMVNKLPSIPLLYGAIWYEYNDSQYTGWPSKDNPYANPAPFSWPAPAVVLQHLKPAN